MHLKIALWQTPKGHKAFNLTPKLSAQTKALATNQGFYDRILVAGGLSIAPSKIDGQTTTFFVMGICCKGLLGYDYRQKII